MQKKYAVAGLYVEGSALFDSISRQAVFYADEPPSTIRRPCSLLRWTQTASTAPYSIMRGAGRSRRPSACWPARWTAVRRGRAAGVYARRDTGGILSGGRCGRLHLSLLCDGHVRPGAGAAAERHTRGEPRPGRNLRRAGGRGRGQQCVYPHTGRNQRLCDREPARARRRRERRHNGGPPRRHCGSGAGHACAHPKLDCQPAV